MIDVVIGQEMHVIEYLPTLGFGVSRLSTGTFGWEGVENQFDTMEAVAAYVVGLLKKAEPDQIDPKCEQAQ